MSETQDGPQGGVPLGIPTGLGPSGRAAAPPVQRVRLTFTKEEALRHIGHLDLVRMWERAFRRAKLPLAYTLGYTPHPRLTFAAPLALGATSSGELVDVYLRERLTPEELVRRIAAQLPEGCAVVDADEVALQGPTVTSLVRWAAYVVEASAADATSEREGGATPGQGSRWAGRGSAPLQAAYEPDDVPWRPPAERLPPPAPEPPLPSSAEIQTRVDALLVAETLPRERIRDGKPVSYDLRPLLCSLRVIEPPDADRVRLDMVVRLNASGAGRPDEICAALGLRARAVRRVRIGLGGSQHRTLPETARRRDVRRA